jgi:hypothetical protein
MVRTLSTPSKQHAALAAAKVPELMQQHLLDAMMAAQRPATRTRLWCRITGKNSTAVVVSSARLFMLLRAW